MPVNMKLAKKQNLSEEQIRYIERLHDCRKQQFQFLEENFDKLSPANIKLQAKRLENLEYSLQDAWGFRRNRYKHKWWFRMPRCTCPTLDNADPVYSGVWTDEICPYHGKC